MGALHPDAACQSVCGRIAEETVNCKRVTGEKGICSNLLENATTGSIMYEVGSAIPEGFQQLSVGKAISIVRAFDDNCFAMCYANDECRTFGGSFCAPNGTCERVFWNKFTDAEGPNYAFLTESGADSVNQASPVLCQQDENNQRFEVEHHEGYVDMCKALCNLTHTQEECSFVQRQSKRCYRLYWSDERKASTVFSVKRLNPDNEVKVQEAFDKLTAQNSDCASLCKAHQECKYHESFCRDNRTCHNLFYQGTDLNNLSICYGPGCSDRTPIMCKLPGDVTELFPSPKAEEVQTAPKRSSAMKVNTPKSASATLAVSATMIAIVATLM